MQCLLLRPSTSDDGVREQRWRSNELTRAHMAPLCLPIAAPPPRSSCRRALITCVHGSRVPVGSAALVVPATAGRVRVITYFLVRSIALVSSYRAHVLHWASVDGRVAERYGGARSAVRAQNRQNFSELGHPGLRLVSRASRTQFDGAPARAPLRHAQPQGT